MQVVLHSNLGVHCIYYTQEYIQLLENTLELINRKQAYMQKLTNGAESFDRNTYTSNVNKLGKVIEGNLERLDELKRLRKSN